MPAAAVASLASKAGVSKGEAEKRWKKAKAAATKAGHGGEYDYIMGTFKRMLGLGEQEAFEANTLLEATVTGMIPMVPNPLEPIGPFSEEERKAVVRKLQTIFPNATEDTIQRVVFGSPLQSLKS